MEHGGPKAGDRVGEYVLEAKVGAGTFGEVWRARHHVWNERVVAVKVPTDPEYVRALQSEGVAIHGLEHPQIVRAINFDPYASPPYLAMEYVPGSSLRAVISAKTLTWRDASAILVQVLGGLGYAHKLGMVHRDIKPENILINTEVAKVGGYLAPGAVKLTDFGLGKKASQYATNSIAYTASIQQGSELAGTIAYMSPEQRSGHEVDARSDIYSCGVMLFEMLTGERPAGTELPTEINAGVPKEFDRIFKRAYARLEMRYTTAEEFAADVTRAAGLVPPPLPPAGGVGAAVTPPVKQSAPPPEGGCPKCHRPVEPTDQFCMHCGMQLVDRVRRCGSCGGYPHPSDHYCLLCGKQLEPVAPPLEAGRWK